MQENGSEMSGKFVGPMPIDEFLDEFLPNARTFGLSEKDKAKFNSVNECKGELSMYEPLVSLLEVKESPC
jgi:hypothetical protein